MRHNLTTTMAILLLAASALAFLPQFSGLSGAAWAQEGGGEGEGKGGQDGDKGKGQDNQGEHGEAQGDHGEGQGGPGEDSDGKGPNAGDPSGSMGGKPAWAQEGISEVELGRLNFVRSPDRVLDQAFEEALASITPDMVAFYNLSVDGIVYELSVNFDTTAYIDSPLQNLSLFKDALDGSTTLASLGVSNDVDTLLSTFLGVASDKTVPITTDTAIAVSTILGLPLSADDAAAIAADAEAIRIAILAGHG